MTSRAWFIVPSAIVLMVVITVWMVKSQTAPHQMYEGKDSVIVTLAATAGGGVEAADGLLERLRHVGISAEPVEVTDTRVRLKLRRVGEPREAVAALIDPEPLHFYVIAADQAPGADAGPPLEDGMVVPWLKGTSRADLIEQIHASPPPPDRVPAIECIRGDGKNIGVLCAAWLAHPPLPLGVKNVKDARIGADKRTEEPTITLHFDEAGTRELERVTSENVGRMIAVVAYGELQARPKIAAPITDGVWTFSTRTGDTDRRNSIERAERLASAARAKPLPPLVIEAVEAAPPGPVRQQ